MSESKITHGELQEKIRERLREAKLLVEKVRRLLRDKTLEDARVVEYTLLDQGSDYTCGKRNLRLNLLEFTLTVEHELEAYRCSHGHIYINYNDECVFTVEDLRSRATDEEFTQNIKYLPGEWEELLDVAVIMQKLANDVKKRSENKALTEKLMQKAERGKPATDKELELAKRLGIDV